VSYRNNGSLRWVERRSGSTLMGEQALRCSDYLPTGELYSDYSVGAGGEIGMRAEYSPGIGALVDGRIQYDHFDLFGSLRLITEESGSVVRRQTYTLYGEEVEGDPESRFGFAALHGYLEGAGAAWGLIHAGARWFDPKMARWFSWDRFGRRGGSNGNELVASMPDRYLDPTGTWAIALPSLPTLASIIGKGLAILAGLPTGLVIAVAVVAVATAAIVYFARPGSGNHWDDHSHRRPGSKPTLGQLNGKTLEELKALQREVTTGNSRWRKTLEEKIREMERKNGRSSGGGGTKSDPPPGPAAPSGPITKSGGQTP